MNKNLNVLLQTVTKMLHILASPPRFSRALKGIKSIKKQFEKTLMLTNIAICCNCPKCQNCTLLMKPYAVRQLMCPTLFVLPVQPSNPYLSHAYEETSVEQSAFLIHLN